MAKTIDSAFEGRDIEVSVITGSSKRILQYDDLTSEQQMLVDEYYKDGKLNGKEHMRIGRELVFNIGKSLGTNEDYKIEVTLSGGKYLHSIERE
ncbi:MAG: hypothetical protein WD876_03025 [Candidatus Pacearchaeota archaeon]